MPDTTKHPDAVPGDDKAHAHSHAAHLDDKGNTQTEPFGKGKQGREPGAVDHAPQNPRTNPAEHSRR